MNTKEWFSTSELLGIVGLPNTPQGINKKARLENWIKRQKAGVRGGANEYHCSNFPEETKIFLGCQHIAPPKLALPAKSTLDIGIRVVEERGRCGITRSKLAQSLNITDEELRSYEVGEENFPALLLSQIGQLGLDISYIMTGKEQKTVPVKQEQYSISTTQSNISGDAQSIVMVDSLNKSKE